MVLFLDRVARKRGREADVNASSVGRVLCPFRREAAVIVGNRTVRVKRWRQTLILEAGGRKAKNVQERCEKKVLFGKDATECWLWQGAQRRGCGRLYMDRGQSVTATRVSWALYRGDVVEGHKVRTTCNTALCVNPDHLEMIPCVPGGAERARSAERKKIRDSRMAKARAKAFWLWRAKKEAGLA